MGNNLKRKTQNRIELFFTKAAMFFVRRGSLKKALQRAERLGWFIFKVVGIRRDVVLNNLKRAFPDKTEDDLKAIALRSYQNFAKTIFEFVRFQDMSKEELFSLCDFVNPELFLNQSGGAVFVAAHFGNWELMAAVVGQLGLPMNVLVRKQRNKLVGELVDSLRINMNVKVIYLGIAVRGAIKAIRNNECVALLGDQGAGKKGIFVDFFGIPSSTHPGPAVLALRTGAPLFFATPVRGEDNRHRISIVPIPLDEYDGATEENIRAVTQIHVKLLESAIRENPDHWFWMHKRWKTKPPKN